MNLVTEQHFLWVCSLCRCWLKNEYTVIISADIAPCWLGVHFVKYQRQTASRKLVAFFFSSSVYLTCSHFLALFALFQSLFLTQLMLIMSFITKSGLPVLSQRIVVVVKCSRSSQWFCFPLISYPPCSMAANVCRYRHRSLQKGLNGN